MYLIFSLFGIIYSQPKSEHPTNHNPLHLSY